MSDDIHYTFDLATVALIKQAWVKRPLLTTEQNEALKQLNPNWQSTADVPEYPAQVIEYIENVDIDGVPTMFRITIRAVKEKG